MTDDLDKALWELCILHHNLRHRINDESPYCENGRFHYVADPETMIVLRKLVLMVRDAAATIMDNEPLMGDYEEFGDAIRKMDLTAIILTLVTKTV
jgi:hypothetical protein